MMYNFNSASNHGVVETLDGELARWLLSWANLGGDDILDVEPELETGDWCVSVFNPERKKDGLECKALGFWPFENEEDAKRGCDIVRPFIEARNEKVREFAKNKPSFEAFLRSIGAPDTLIEQMRKNDPAAFKV